MKPLQEQWVALLWQRYAGVFTNFENSVLMAADVHTKKFHRRSYMAGGVLAY